MPSSPVNVEVDLATAASPARLVAAAPAQLNLHTLLPALEAL
ncbi:hypothetical protein [Streptosporangium sp. NPDC000509]